MRLRWKLLSGMFAIGLFIHPFTAAGAALKLQADTDVATAGYFQLHWDAGQSTNRLVESRDPEFENRRVVYEGPDTARLMSGKRDGQYYYRLERTRPSDSLASEPEIVSNTLQVTVSHHSTERAFTFFAIGAVVFLATLIMVLAGGASERRQ